MKKILVFLLLYTCIFVNAEDSNIKYQKGLKYYPQTRDESVKLIKNESVNLGDYCYNRYRFDSRIMQRYNDKILARVPIGSKIVLLNLETTLDIKDDITAQERMLGISKKSSEDSIKDLNIESKNTKSSKDSSHKASKDTWIKYLYFPPDKNNAKDAIIGYVHGSLVSDYKYASNTK